MTPRPLPAPPSNVRLNPADLIKQSFEWSLMAAVLDLVMVHEVRVSRAGLQESEARFALISERDLPVDPLPRLEYRRDAEEMDSGDFGGRDRLWEHELCVFLVRIHVGLADAVVTEDRSIFADVALMLAGSDEFKFVLASAANRHFVFFTHRSLLSQQSFYLLQPPSRRSILHRLSLG